MVDLLRAWPAAAASRPRAVFFDAGMTLIHPSGDILLAELAAHGVDLQVDARTVACALLLSAEARHLPLPAEFDGAERVALAWGRLLGLDSHALPACVAALSRPDLYCELDTEAHELLRVLTDLRITLGVVSNSGGTLRADLAAFDLLPYFDVVVDSTVVGIEKPAPGIFEHALSGLGIAADRCWYVGDGLVNDVLGAQAAGFACGVLYDRFRCFEHVHGVARITRLADLATAVSMRH